MKISQGVMVDGQRMGWPRVSGKPTQPTNTSPLHRLKQTDVHLTYENNPKPSEEPSKIPFFILRVKQNPKFMISI